MDRQNLTLLTDLYELTMMQGYFKNKEENNTVIFDAFFRNNPFGGGYSIMCGIEQLVKYVKELHFSKEDVDYLRGLGIFDEDFLEYLAGFHFTGSIYAIPEGALMFPREPMVKVIAPIMEAQLVETAILNIINHQSLIATKAARICYAARGDGIMEFGLRRAQGPDAGTYGARAAVIAGCVGTSNVLCGQLFDVPVKGTHAHSWIMSFPDAIISASNDLDEHLIDSLKNQGATITSWGVGTHLITAKDNPSFGGVYKLAAIGNPDGTFDPKIKLSENTEKVTNPGNKKIYRIYEKASHKIIADLICLEEETFTSDRPLVIFDPIEPWKKTHLEANEFELRELMIPLFIKGECVYEFPRTMDIREYCLAEQETLWEESRRLVNPHQIYVDLSRKLYDTKLRLLDEVGEKTQGIQS